MNQSALWRAQFRRADLTTGAPRVLAARDDHDFGLAVDTHGNLAVADTGNRRLRVIAAYTGRLYRRPMTAAHIYTIAGTGQLNTRSTQLS